MSNVVHESSSYMWLTVNFFFLFRPFICIIILLTMSSSTTKKFREFMAEPLGDKTIQDVPGIGDVLGTKLSEAGYEKVCLDSSKVFF
jgi:hypothetical protein